MPHIDELNATMNRHNAEVVRLAAVEGHDADIATNEGVYETEDLAKSSKAASVSSASLGELGGEKDMEKGDLDEKHVATEEITGVQSISDPNTVDWDGPDDPANPMNWSTKKKSLNVFVLSMLTLVPPLASSMFAPGVPEVMSHFKSNSNTLAEFVVSVFLLGFAFGPLVVSPMAECYGRFPVYCVCNLLFTLFTVICAVSNSLGMLIGFRFLAGCVGVGPVTIGGGTIADMISQQKRGGAMAIWAMGPLLGPVIGPVCGGYLTAAAGWRWVFWVLAIASGVLTVAAALLMKETYAPILLARKAARLRKETGNPDLRSKLDTGATPRDLFLRSIVRPSKMLFMSPIVFLMSLYIAIVYGILYLLFTTFTYVFTENYGFTDQNVGLVYVGTGIGMLLGLFILGACSDRLMAYLSKKHGGGMKAEYRLPPLTIGGVLVPLGLFLYGWTAEYKIQWAVPLLGTLFVGMGMLMCFMCIQTYLVDAFTVYAASALAANTVLRSIFGAFLPLAGLQMYDKLGYGWGNSLLGFLALAMIPIPVMFYKYGERIRTNPRFQVKF